MPKSDSIVYRGSSREQLNAVLQAIAPVDDIPKLLEQYDNGEFPMLAVPVGDLGVGRDLDETTWTVVTHSRHKPEKLTEQRDLLSREAPGVDVAFADDILGRR